jgi:hypothetical protein
LNDKAGNFAGIGEYGLHEDLMNAARRVVDAAVEFIMPAVFLPQQAPRDHERPSASRRTACQLAVRSMAVESRRYAKRFFVMYITSRAQPPR